LKPKPFVPEIFNGNERYVRDKIRGSVWHRCQYRTLYADTDQSQIVYHANYLRYFEFGRSSLMRDSNYTYRGIEESGYIYPIIEIGVNYFSPLYYDDSMWIHTRISEMERVKLRFEYIITNENTGEIVCMGFTKHCATNKSGTPVGIDGNTVQLWETFPK